MTPDRKHRPSAAMIVAAMALIVSLGTGAYAATQLPANSVGTKQLKNRAVTNQKLATNAVTGSKVRNNSVPGSKIVNNSLTGSKINAATLGTVPTAQNALSLGGFAANTYQRSCQPGAVAAYAYVKGNPGFSATYTSANPPVQDQFNCTGGVVQVKRTAAGVYDVHFAGLDNGQELIVVGNQSVDPAGTQVNGGELTFKLVFDATVNATVYQIRLDNTAAATVDNEFSIALLSPR